MKALLFDADAFLCARKLGLLQPLSHATPPVIQLVMTEYVARHELNDVRGDVDELCERGVLRIEAMSSTDVYRFKNKVNKSRTRPPIHKGEAEAIVWAVSQPREQRPRFITNDRGARRAAEENKVPVGDLFDFVATMLEEGIADREVMADNLSIWDVDKQAPCYPRDWQGFEATYALRAAR